MAYANRGDYYNAELALRWVNSEHDKEARAFNRSMNKIIRDRGGAVQDRGVGAYPNNVGKIDRNLMRKITLLTTNRASSRSQKGFWRQHCKVGGAEEGI
jgi:hypothetical protein